MLTSTQLLKKNKDSQYERIMEKARETINAVHQEMSKKAFSVHEEVLFFHEEIMEDPFRKAKKELGKYGYKLGRIKDPKKLFISW